MDYGRWGALQRGLQVRNISNSSSTSLFSSKLNREVTQDMMDTYKTEISSSSEWTWEQGSQSIVVIDLLHLANNIAAPSTSFGASGKSQIEMEYISCSYDPLSYDLPLASMVDKIVQDLEEKV